jgi:hypothetical protein
MRTAIAAIAGAAAALVAASALGVAAAEAPTVSPTRTVAVQGIATVPIAQGSSASAATAVYRQAMAAAVTDGQSKAEFLAAKVGATLGPAQTVSEDGGSISCTGTTENGYVAYEGEQPDFGNARVLAGGVLRAAAAAPSGAPAPRPLVKRHKPRRKAKGKAALVSGCTLQAEVSLAYALG